MIYTEWEEYFKKIKDVWKWDKQRLILVSFD